VLGQLGIGRVELGVVEAGLRDGRAQVVGDGDLGDAAVVGPHVLMGPEPGAQVLSPRRLDVQQARAAEHCDEDLGLPRLAGIGVDDLHRVAREVDEAPLACSVAEAHHDVLSRQPGLVVVAELAVAVTVGMLLPPLEPDQPERHVMVTALQLPVHRPPVRHRPGCGARCARSWVEHLLESFVIEVVGERPGEPERLGSREHLVDGALARCDARCDLPFAESCCPQAQGFSDLSHG
jgi:hypothetical protein